VVILFFGVNKSANLLGCSNRTDDCAEKREALSFASKMQFNSVCYLEAGWRERGSIVVRSYSKDRASVTSRVGASEECDASSSHCAASVRHGNL